MQARHFVCMGRRKNVCSGHCCMVFMATARMLADPSSTIYDDINKFK